jgi:hypothetical protein
MDLIKIERVGGLAGFGGSGSKIKSRGEVSLAKLCVEDQLVVENLFNAKGKSKLSKLADGFCYKLTRTSKQGLQTIEVPEAQVPAAIAQCLKDELT